MTGGPERRVFSAARIVGACRAHPALSWLVAALAVAAAAASGYLTHATLSQPAPAATAGAPVIERGSPEHAARLRDTVVWRDETGAIYRAKVAGGRFADFLRQQHGAVEEVRTETRNQAATEIATALTPVFAEMRTRVPTYADWYFGYTTRYELIAHALIPAIGYLSRSLDGLVGQDPRHEESMVKAIGAHMTEYLQEQYAERVLWPRETEIRLQAIFDKSYGALQARWTRIIAEQRAAMRAFIKEQAGAGERLSTDQAAQAAGLKLDWDGGRTDGSAMHKEGVIEQSFRRGVLSFRVTIPKSAKVPAEPDTGDNTGTDPMSDQAAAENDEITHVIVNLFDKVVGPVVSQMGDLATGIFAGGAASGTTLGMGMAGFGPIGPAMAVGARGVATGFATAVPIGGAIGLAATVVAEMLSNRLEAALTRDEFEENIRQTVGATENAVETKMISFLHAHIAAWYADAVNPVAVK